MKWMMLTAVALTTAFIFYLHNNPVNDQMSLSEPDFSQPETPISVEKPEKQITLQKHKKKLKKVRNNTQTSNSSHAKGILSKASPAGLSGEKSAVKPAAKSTKESGRWIGRLSGEKAQIHLKANKETEQDCVSKECKLNDVYSLVGMVVETRRLNQKKYNLIDGGLGVGDTQKLPLVYVK